MSLFTRLATAARRRERGVPALVVSGLYAALVLGTAVFVEAVVLFSEDPGFVGVWLVLVTLPLSTFVLGLTTVLVPDGGGGILESLVLFTIPCAAVGLLQSWLLWRVFRGRRREPAPR
ncbi:SCO4225 family membrane protein [Thermomonospora umbrina]|uniref:SCO4225 family membrane protein n=1 Tax=Thermomonospora umbrina TaxID=111806 RepID=UPI000E25C3A6|nr:hypothetical protein [Thermomonospora umbrina]